MFPLAIKVKDLPSYLPLSVILCRKTLRKWRAEDPCSCSKSYRRAWLSSQTPSEPIPCQYLPGLPGTVGGGSGYGESGGERDERLFNVDCIVF